MRRDQSHYSGFAHDDPPLLRFYSWSEPTVSLGRFQQVTPAFAARLETLNLTAVRRPTGGAAILHAGDLTFSLVGPADWLPASLLEGHALLSRALSTGLQKLGIRADSGAEPAGTPQVQNCFARITPADLHVPAGKLVGTAQVRRRSAFLIQGMLYVQADQTLLRELFAEEAVPMTDLTHLLDPVPPQAEIIRALAGGFAEVLDLDLRPAQA